MKFSQRYRVIFCTFIISGLWTSYLISEPLLQILEPTNKVLTSKSRILFKGNTTEIEWLKINGIKVEIDEEGRFYAPQELTETNKRNYFTLLAKTTSGETIKLVREVFRFSKPMEQKKIMEARSILMKGYNPLGWKKRPFSERKQRNLKDFIKVRLEGKPKTISDQAFDKQLETILSYSTLLSNQGSVIFTLPWCGTFVKLEDVSISIAKFLDRFSLGIAEDITVVWYNRYLGVCEVYYQNGKTQVLLNDKSLTKMSKTKRTGELTHFIQGRFVP